MIQTACSCGGAEIDVLKELNADKDGEQESRLLLHPFMESLFSKKWETKADG